MQRWPRAIGIVLTVGILVFIIYRLDLLALRRTLAQAHYIYVLHVLVTTLILYGVGTLQWRLVLSPVQWVRPLRLFGAQMVAALVHGLLSFPVGGLVEAYIVARRGRASMSAVLATTLVDRLVDGFAFLGLLGFVLTFTELPMDAAPAQAALRLAGWISLGLYLSLAMLLLLLGAFPDQGAAMVSRVLGGFSRRWSQWAAAAYTRFCQGIGLPERWRDRSLLVVWAMGKKAIIPFQVYWSARAFGLDLPWTAYPFQVVFLGFLVFLTGAIGIRGTYQAGMVVVLGFYGAPKEVALAIAVMVQVVSHGAAMVMGLAFVWWEGFTLDEFRALCARWQGSS